jgi:HNH endonuclease
MKSLQITKGKKVLLDEVDFPWANQWKWIAPDNGAGQLYAARRKGKRIILLHRELLGVPSGTLVDHRNGDTLDCRRDNLRPATKAQNGQNSRKTRKPTTSRYKGVCHVPRLNQTNPWMAYIGGVGGPTKRTYLGYFPNESSAARAYDIAARQLFGEFAKLNFPI